ncbi:hypothetical protein GCM10009592_26920 [Brachybacterium rhamnosum]|uniref:Uncharacterized protein n=1 Tax=Brachybacterium rhamnosum TaxID=173361 RepID=A0ABW4Q1A0_9MICO
MRATPVYDSTLADAIDALPAGDTAAADRLEALDLATLPDEVCPMYAKQTWPSPVAVLGFDR